MKFEFEVNSAADAQLAAAVMAGVAAAFGGEVPTQTTRRRSTSTTAPLPSAEKLAEAFNAVAEATGGAKLPADTLAADVLKAETAIQTAEVAEVAEGLTKLAEETAESAAANVPPADTAPPARTRAELETVVRAGAVDRGIVWVRDNVFAKYNVKKPAELTDAQLVELVTTMESGN